MNDLEEGSENEYPGSPEVPVPSLQNETSCSRRHARFMVGVLNIFVVGIYSSFCTLEF